MANKDMPRNNSIIPLEAEAIRARIYNIRAQQVMLDKDIASLYNVKPIRLREQVQRNIERFPEDFMFQLTEGEVDFMVSQNAIPSRKHLGGSLPYVFTEQGVASLSGVLKSSRAAEVHVKIMRAFVEMRRFILNNAQVFLQLDSVERRQIAFESDAEKNFEKVFNALEAGEPPKRGGMKCEVRNVNGEFLRTLDFPLQTSKRGLDCHMATPLSCARASTAAHVRIGRGVNKAEKHYSPTTMYEDYETSDTLFHWQSQSRTTDRSDTGQRYIHHRRLDHKILLFVREDRTNQGNLAEPYHFLGTADYVSHTGSRPMSITWQLHCPMPAFLLQRTSRLAAGVMVGMTIQ